MRTRKDPHLSIGVANPLSPQFNYVAEQKYHL